MSAFKIYESALVKGTLKESVCKKCGAVTITAKMADKSAKIQWQVFDKEHSEITEKGRGFSNVYHCHFMYCFPNGMRFAFGDKILYAPFKQPEERGYKIIGVDEHNKYYYIQDIKNPKLQQNKAMAYFVDKRAVPLTEAAELLFV